MHLAVALDSPHQTFTNLDHVSGAVTVYVPNPINVISVVAKLEGESITELLAPPAHEMDDKPRPLRESHKILYMTQQVFSTQKPASYTTLMPGTYKYLFTFKLPFNTMCHESGNLNFQSFPDFIKGKSNGATTVTGGHVKTPLPPTLGGFPGLASIRYYVKVTVNRKEFYKENPRIVQNINFVPIEPPRPPPSTNENFGRRTYQFQPQQQPQQQFQQGQLPSRPNLSKMFSDLKVKSRSSSAASIPQMAFDLNDPPRVAVEIRLPEPAILTASENVPLRIMVTRLDRGDLPLLYLQSLQVELVGTTNIRAGQVSRVEASSWILTSTSNMNRRLDFPAPSNTANMVRDDPSQSEKAPLSTESATPSSSHPPEKDTHPVYPPEKNSSQARPVPPTPESLRITLPPTWLRPLSGTIPPSFKTCNLTRTYALEVRVGIGYSESRSGPGQSAKNQITLPLRLPCQVWSGIKPPEGLVTRVSKVGAPAPFTIGRKPIPSAAQAAMVAAPFGSTSGTPPQAGIGTPAIGAQGEEEPPPSYEDAMGIDLGPVDGLRNYQPQPPRADGDGFGEHSAKQDR